MTEQGNILQCDRAPHSFMQSVSEGETLFAQGPAHHFDASIAFYKALKVYPNPMELVMIYQKAVPQEVFGIIMEMVAADVSCQLRRPPHAPPLCLFLTYCAPHTQGKLNGGESADPLSSLAGAAAGAPTRTAASLDEVDDDSPSGGAAAGPSAGASPVSQPVSSSASGEHDASSQEGNRGPPSTYSSQEGNGIASGYSSNPEGSATGGNASAYSSQEWEKVSTSSGSATVGGPSSSNEGINLPDVASAPVELDAAPAPAAAATGTAAGHADEDVKAPAPPATSTADIFNAAPAPEATTEQAAISAQQDIFAAVQDAAQDADAASSQAPQ